MLRIRGSFFLALMLAGAGCSAVINPDDGRLGGPRDAGTDDFDSGIRLMDSGPRPDTGTPPRDDAGGSTCVSEEPRCMGDALVTCVGGREIAQDCQARMAYCDEGECRDWECEPSSRTCTDDLSASLVCDARGTRATEMECTGVCNVATGRCGDVVDACAMVPVVTVGTTQRIELCTKHDDNTHTPAEGCSATTRANGPDTIFRLVVPFGQTVTIELTDVDTARAIDTILYVRSVCDAPGTQIACDDDVPCSSSTVPGADLCIGGFDVRQSRIRTRLEAGEYFIVMDAFLYTEGSTAFTCGDVELSVRGG